MIEAGAVKWPKRGATTVSERVDATAELARAAFQNEAKTRTRVADLEGAFNALGERSLWGRLKWLLTGN